MFAQLKYAARISLGPRLITLGISLAVSLVFFGLNMLKLLPPGWVVMGFVLAGLSYTALFAAALLADFETIRSLFSAPGGYATLLTPVAGWKIILSRALVMTVFDLASLVIGGLGVALHVGSMSTHWNSGDLFRFRSEDLQLLFFIVVGYLMLLLLITFCCALTKSLFFPLRARGFLGLLSTCVLVYLAGYLNLLLTPFATVTRFRAFISVNLVSGWNAGMIAFMILTLIEAAVLLIATSYLYERKVNL